MLHIAKIVRLTNLSRGVPGPIRATIETLAWMSRVANQRHALRMLDDRQLQDLGLSRADALREANRPFWDLPARSQLEVSERREAPRRGPKYSGRAGTQLPTGAVPTG